MQVDGAEPPWSLAERMNFAWRMLGTACAFVGFGMVGLLILLVIYPLTRCFIRRIDERRRLMQAVNRRAFQLFFRCICFLRLMTYSVEGKEGLEAPGQLIIANHPTLIDVVLLVSLIPRSNCIVKADLLRNPFLRGPVTAAGYIHNATDSGTLLRRCNEAMSRGESLLIFPEGTRSVPGQAITLQRGTANIALRTGQPLRPVIIHCDPPTLSKGLPWYAIPRRRFHMQLTVKEPIALEPFLDEHEQMSRSARALTRYLEKYLSNNGEC